MNSHRTPDERPGASQFRPDIEGLRAVAVSVVLLHHAGLAIPGGGFAGVDIFFVVSGFVITAQLLRELERTGRISLPGFYARRARRLLPAAAVVLVVTTLMSWLSVSRVQWQAISTDIIGAATYVVNWVFSARSVDYMAEDVAPSPVLHFWSLAVEEQFYFIWPLVLLGLLWVGGKRRRHDDTTPPRRAILAIGLTLVIVIPSLLCAFWLTAERPSQAFFVTPTRLWELGIGALVALGATQWNRLSHRAGQALVLAGLAVLGTGLMLQSTQTAWPAPGALVPTLGTAAVIVGGFSAGHTGVGRLLGNPLFVWVGGLSYSLYLWHWPALRMATWQWGELSAAQGLLVVLLSVVPAWLSYRFVESPVRHSKAIAASPRLALSIGLNCTLVAAVAGLVLQGAVLQSRGTASGIGGAGIQLVPEQLRGQETNPPSADTTPLFDVITPDPVDAVLDSPALYEKGCAVEVYDTGVKACDSGDPAGGPLVVVVGDSKVAQWMPAIDAIAEANHWRVRIYTKGGCTFTDTMTFVAGEPFPECREWGQEVFRRLVEAKGKDRPQVMITTGLRKAAADADGEETLEGLVAGYVSYWQQLTDQGTRVIALSDTPSPSPEIGANAYECVAEHDAATAGDDCSWPYAESSSNLAMKEAAGQVKGAAFIDMNPLVCPDGVCRAVIRNVLTYRQGSHITATWVKVLAPDLANELVPLVSEHLTSAGKP